MSKRGLGFLEDKLDAAQVSWETNQYVLSLIPYEQTTTYITGTKRGPRAIIEASGHIELLDETLRIDASSHGILTLAPDISDLESVTAHVSRITEEHPGALLGFLGGEHSITPGIIEGFPPNEIGIVWIDAHADLRQRFHGREDNHACAALNAVQYGAMVQVGVRSLASEEAAYLERSDQVKSFRYWNDQAKDAIRGLPGRVYLSVDMDGFSPMLVRGVGTPEPGGLMWEEVMDILDFLFGEKDVFAFDIVELCPREDDVVSSYTAARLVYKVMAYHTYHKLRGIIPPGR